MNKVLTSLCNANYNVDNLNAYPSLDVFMHNAGNSKGLVQNQNNEIITLPKAYANLLSSALDLGSSINNFENTQIKLLDSLSENLSLWETSMMFSKYGALVFGTAQLFSGDSLSASLLYGYAFYAHHSPKFIHKINSIRHLSKLPKNIDGLFKTSESFFESARDFIDLSKEVNAYLSLSQDVRAIYDTGLTVKIDCLGLVEKFVDDYLNQNKEVRYTDKLMFKKSIL